MLFNKTSESQGSPYEKTSREISAPSGCNSLSGSTNAERSTPENVLTDTTPRINLRVIAFVIGCIITALAVLSSCTTQNSSPVEYNSNEDSSNAAVSAEESSASASVQEFSDDRIEPDPIIEIPDPELKKILQDSLGIGDREITEADALLLESLDYSDNTVLGINDVTGLSSFKNLKVLKLPYNLISDITPLAGLTKLTELYLFGNQISDISPLANLTDLTSLNLGDNQIEDITPLQKLTKLEDLTLSFNRIEDTSPLAGLTNLTDLMLIDNQTAVPPRWRN